MSQLSYTTQKPHTTRLHPCHHHINVQQYNERGGMTISLRKGQTPLIQWRAWNHPSKDMLETPSFEAYS